MNPTNPTKPCILLTIDVEDWFQVENFKQYIPFSSWSSCELRVERNTHRLLDLFDSIKLDQSNRQLAISSKSNSESALSEVVPERSFPQACLVESGSNSSETQQSSENKKIHATFFVLGWIAERLPKLVREIHSRGHEVASHGYFHTLCAKSARDDLKKDLVNSKRLLEDILGERILGYRAPGFSIDHDILQMVEDSGYAYDSSYNSFSINKRYGQLPLNGNGKQGIAFHISGSFYELPISNLTVGKGVVPWGGGGYFRLIPLRLFCLGAQAILNRDKAYVFYMHPWEIDPEQPKVNSACLLYRFRHYLNLNKTDSRLSNFVETFSQYPFMTCQQYLKGMNQAQKPS
jgi:polysaccharide deacetylase family protein (PEP-CTERM system associated)